MTTPKTIDVKLERTIPASVEEVFDAWLNPKIPGTPWFEGEKILLNPKVDGFFYWLIHETGHYGRFTELQRPSRLQHTWVSPNTMGLESIVTLTFQKKGNGTLLTLVHTGLPETDPGRSHEKGWGYFLDRLTNEWGKASH